MYCRCYKKYRSEQFLVVPKKGSSKHSSAMLYGRLVFCKHVFQPMSESWEDAVEYHLLYAQAMHYVVQVSVVLMHIFFLMASLKRYTPLLQESFFTSPYHQGCFGCFGALRKKYFMMASIMSVVLPADETVVLLNFYWQMAPETA